MNAPAMATRHSILERRDAGGIATLTLNDPSSRNSLSEAMLAALSQTLASIADDRSVRAVVLAAVGPCYSSGHNLKEMTARRADPDRGRDYFAGMMKRCAAMMQQIVTLPQPVIAAVQGLATAAGCQLVATCDLAVASDEARFCTPGVNIGLFCSTPMVALSRAVGRKPAMEMLLSGLPVDAAAAERWGLVNRAVAPEALEAEVEAMARLIASKSPHTLKVGKEAFYRQMEMGLDDAYRHASRVMTENMLAMDAAEGIDAFLEKRPPVWRGC